MPDFAAVALAALLILVLLVVIVQFFLWVRLKYDIKAEIVSWKGVMENVVQESRQAKTIAEAEREARGEVLAISKSNQHALTALEESFAHFNAKTIARERELSKAAKRDNRQAGQDAAQTEAFPDDQAQAFAAALAAQAAHAGNNGQAKPHAARIRIKGSR